MARILVIRLSAIGDVAMTVPVVHSVALSYPQHEFVILSRQSLKPLFQYMPANISFFGINSENRYDEGLNGLNRLYKELRKRNITHVADLHDVLRSKYLRMRFRLSGIPVVCIDKGRKGKRKLVRKNNKVLELQKTSFRRYMDVFEKLGFPFRYNFLSLFGEERGDLSSIGKTTGQKGSEKWIGIAPFARHKGKIYPLELQEQVVAHFSKQPGIKVFLFGGGAKEKTVFDGWIAKYPTLVSLIGKLNMMEEFVLMSHLDVMLSMDSANMHLASLVNVPVVSIWGATHPYAGFMGWMQLPTNTIQLDLSCRPCSVYGNKPCWRKDYACLYQIPPEQVIGKIEGLIN